MEYQVSSPSESAMPPVTTLHPLGVILWTYPSQSRIPPVTTLCPLSITLSVCLPCRPSLPLHRDPKPHPRPEISDPKPEPRTRTRFGARTTSPSCARQRRRCCEIIIASCSQTRFGTSTAATPPTSSASGRLDQPCITRKRARHRPKRNCITHKRARRHVARKRSLHCP